MEILELKSTITEIKKLSVWAQQQKGGTEERLHELEGRITEINQSDLTERENRFSNMESASRTCGNTTFMHSELWRRGERTQE